MQAPETVLQPGFVLDRYELLCPIASGGMAEVWLARMRGKHGFEKLFAVKTIRTELSDDPRFEQMFLDEAHIASQIQHPNVAQILDLGEQQKILYLVMEWVDGESLARVRKIAAKAGAGIPYGMALRVIADAAAGLHAAHELKDTSGQPLGIVHRDVSPQNILVSTQGSIKVIDFGIAKASNRAAPQTRTGVVKGKLQYMAPEQALGHAMDRRVDIWALGCCLYELVTTRLPFDGDNQLELLSKITAQKPPPPMGEDVPPAIEEIVMRAMQPNPELRYATAAEMRRAIETVMTDLELRFTTEDVGAFIEAHLPERAVERQEIVSKALKAAVSRDAAPVSGFEKTMEVEKRGSSTKAATVASTPHQQKPAKVVRLTEKDKTKKKRGTTGVTRTRAISGGDDDVPSNATLGSAALASPNEWPAGVPKRGRGVWAVALLLLVGASGWYVWRQYARSSASRASASQTATAATTAAASTAAPSETASAPASAPPAKASTSPSSSASAHPAATHPTSQVPPGWVVEPEPRATASASASAPPAPPATASTAPPRDLADTVPTATATATATAEPPPAETTATPPPPPPPPTDTQPPPPAPPNPY